MISKKQYAKMVKKATPPSPKLKNFIKAFIIGGLICVLGQMLKMLYINLGQSEEVVKMLVPITLIFLASLLTGLKIFHKIAKHAEVSKCFHLFLHTVAVIVEPPT